MVVVVRQMMMMKLMKLPLMLLLLLLLQLMLLMLQCPSELLLQRRECHWHLRPILPQHCLSLHLQHLQQ